MAYLRFEQIHSLPASIATRASAPILDTFEREVVRMSLSDDRASLMEPGWLTRIGMWLGTVRRRNGLANARLEALRRYAILYRFKGKSLRASDELAIAGAGFGVHAVREIRRIVDRHVAGHTRTPRPSFSSLVFVLALFGALTATVLLVRQATGDLAISAMIAALIFVTIISLHRPATRDGQPRTS